MPRPPRPVRRPLIRLDADGAERTAPDWESLTERLIREAQEAGAFDGLPGQGRPIRLEDETFAGDMALAHHLLRNAGVAPPWIEADKEVRAAAEDIEGLLRRARVASPIALSRLARELEDLADTHDGAVGRLEGLAPTPRQQRRRLDRAQLKARLVAALAVAEDGS